MREDPDAVLKLKTNSIKNYLFNFNQNKVSLFLAFVLYLIYTSLMKSIIRSYLFRYTVHRVQISIGECDSPKWCLLPELS